MKKLSVLLLLLSLPMISKAYSNGENLYAMWGCLSCHGKEGKGAKSGADVNTRLSGKKKQYLIDQIQDFQSGKRNKKFSPGNKAIMMMLSKRDIEGITEYLSKVGVTTDNKYKENTHYRVVKDINLTNINKPTIVEYFWLGCSHCQNFEPILNNFQRKNPNVSILKKHAALNQRWTSDARVFYTLKEMNKMEHFSALFSLYKNKKAPTKAHLDAFLKTKSIDADDFFNLAYNNENVSKNIKESSQEMEKNKIAGVPAVVVIGQYFIMSSEDIKTVDDYYDLVNYLLSK